MAIFYKIWGGTQWVSARREAWSRVARGCLVGVSPWWEGDHPFLTPIHSNTCCAAENDPLFYPVNARAVDFVLTLSTLFTPKM